MHVYWKQENANSINAPFFLHENEAKRNENVFWTTRAQSIIQVKITLMKTSQTTLLTIRLKRNFTRFRSTSEWTVFFSSLCLVCAIKFQEQKCLENTHNHSLSVSFFLSFPLFSLPRCQRERKKKLFSLQNKEKKNNNKLFILTRRSA